jgi:Spx/MgsR family transcriptional regulator
MKLYGIPTCDTVRKARKFFKEHNIEIEFINFKKESIDCKEVDFFLKHITIDSLFNSRGTTYKKLKLKELDLSDSEKREWLCKENMLFKRPIIEFDSKAIVGFDEENYKKLFLKY